MQTPVGVASHFAATCFTWSRHYPVRGVVWRPRQQHSGPPYGVPSLRGRGAAPASFPERRPSGRRRIAIASRQRRSDRDPQRPAAPRRSVSRTPSGGSRDLAAGGSRRAFRLGEPAQRRSAPTSAHDAYSARRLPRRSLPGLAEPRPPRQPKRRVCCKDAGAESSRGSTAGGCPDSVRLHAIGPPHALQRRSGALAGQLRGAQRARREDWSARRRRRRGQPYRRDRRGSAVAAAGTFIAAGGGA